MGLARWGAEKIKLIRKKRPVGEGEPEDRKNSSPYRDVPLKIDDLTRDDLHRVLSGLIDRHPDLTGEVKSAVVKIKDEVQRSVKQVEGVKKTDEPAEKLFSRNIIKYLAKFKSRFDALPQLHKGIEWADVEKSLKADTESMANLQALDAKGHAMNVFCEENGEFIFVSAWDDYERVSPDHKYIAYDPDGQKLAEKEGHKPKGNAVSIIAGIMGIKEDEAENYLADSRFHDQLRKTIAVKGWAWLKTSAATRKSGIAFVGNDVGIYKLRAYKNDDSGSFRAMLRVKKV